MSIRRRLALVVVALPLVGYAYACSSDSGSPAATPAGGDEGGTDGSMPGTDSSMPGTDSSMPGTDAGGDASDGAVAPTCIGNPLTPDGGTLDGGVTLDAAVATQIVTVGAGTFLDGPQWLDANGGFLVYSENDPDEQLFKVNANGSGNVRFREAGLDDNHGPVGSAMRNGLLVTAVDAKSAGGVPKFILTAPDGGAAGTLLLGDSGSTAPNDLVVGPGGDIYFTDGQYQPGIGGTTGLYRIYPDAAVAAVQKDFGRANGIALSPDNTKLYVGIGPISSAEADPKSVLVYNVGATGAVTGPGTSFLAPTDLADVPDGMAVDVGGNLWIAEAAANGAPGGRVEVFSPAKKKLGTIPFPAPHRPTSVAFGGADGKTLFVTTETGVFTYVSRCAGIE